MTVCGLISGLKTGDLEVPVNMHSQTEGPSSEHECCRNAIGDVMIECTGVALIHDILYHVDK